MAVLVRMPRYGANMEEGTVSSLRFKEGEKIEEGQVLCEIEIEKLINELEAPEGGTVRQLFCSEGEVLPCGAPLAIIAGATENIEGLVAESAAATTMDGTPPPDGSDASPGATAAPPSAARADESPSAFTEVPGLRITPKALALARELGVDYAPITGTGLHGAITRADVRAAARPGEATARMEGAGSDRRPMTPTRRATARKMVQSLTGTAQASIMRDTDVTDLVAAYGRAKRRYADEGLKLTYTAIIAKALAQTLGKHPGIRTIVVGDSSLETRTELNIGVAVDNKDGLTVPVLRNVDRNDLADVCRQIVDITERSDSRSLTAEDFPPAAMTISNLGHLGITYFTPVLNPPESAILGVGAVRESPVVVDDGVHVRWMMALSMTFDHRAIDGVPAARFLADLCALLASGHFLGDET